MAFSRCLRAASEDLVCRNNPAGESGAGTVAFDVGRDFFVLARDSTAFLEVLFAGLAVFFPVVTAPAGFFFDDAARADLPFTEAGFRFTVLAARAAFLELVVFLTFCPNFPRNQQPVNLKR